MLEILHMNVEREVNRVRWNKTKTINFSCIQKPHFKTWSPKVRVLCVCSNCTPVKCTQLVHTDHHQSS